MLDALKLKDSYIQEFDETINSIFKFYYYSPVRRKELKEMAKEIEVEFKQLGLLKNIKWLASRSRALNILEYNYMCVVFDLECRSYGKDETAKKAQGFLNFLKKPTFLFYLHFFQDFVESLQELSLIFQRNEPLACEIPRLINEKIMNLEMLSVVSEGVNRLKENFSVNTSDEIIYDSDIILDIPAGRRDIIEHNINSYVISYTCRFGEIILETQGPLRRRFQDFERLPLKVLCEKFDFKLWQKSSANDNKKWGFYILEGVLKYYVEHGFMTEDEAVKCKRQWPLIRSRINTLRTEKVLRFTRIC